MGTLLAVPLSLLYKSTQMNHQNMGSVQRLNISDGVSPIGRIRLDSGQGVQVTRKHLLKLFCLLINPKHEISQLGSLYAVSLHVRE
jgi:hypothetical protein